MNIPGYQVIKQIGQGGMATVYLAIQESLGRQVALKVMNSSLATDTSFTDRFLKEGRIVAQFQHPQIITIFDFGSSHNNSYFSMELLNGGTLADQMHIGLTIEDSVNIIRYVADALGYAHQRGVLHRDIKPQNIMFRDNGAPVLTDFGIAKRIDAKTQLTATGLTVGSPTYMSPEQIVGKKLDARSDLYSLGILFYQMLTNQLPYQAEEMISLAVMHCSAPLPILPEQFMRYQPVIEKSLQKKPEERFESAEAFIQALDPLCEQRFFSSTTLTLPTIIVGNTDTAIYSKTTRHSSNKLRIPAPPMTVKTGRKTAAHIAPSDTQQPTAFKQYVIIGLIISTVVAGAGLYMSLPYFNQPSTALQQSNPLISLPIVPTNRTALVTDYEHLALNHLEKNDYIHSLEVVNLALNVAPTDSRLLALRNQVHQLQAATNFFNQAQQLYNKDELEASLTTVKQGLQLVATHPQLLTLQQRIQADMQQQALQYATQYFNQAQTLFKQREFAASLEKISTGLKHVSNHPELLALQLTVQQSLHQQQQAE